MGITVADNFKHLSKKFLDDRASFDTLADMKAASDASIPEGFETYCKATDKYYKFMSTNTVDADTGKWRERESGGGGTTDYTALENKPQIEGVTLSGNKTAADLGLAKSNQIPTVPTKVSQLQNDSGFITSSSLPGVYAGDTAGLVPAAGSDNEGKFLDNNGNWTDPLEDLVQNSGGKVLLDIPSNTYASYNDAFAVVKNYLDTLSDEQLPSIVLCYSVISMRLTTVGENRSYYSFSSHKLTSSSGTVTSAYTRIGRLDATPGLTAGQWNFGTSGAVTYSDQSLSSGAQANHIQLIDTSVSATMIGKINRSDIYDTTEKVIGKWTDGRPLYQKTIACSGLPNNTTKSFAHSISNISSIIDVHGIAYAASNPPDFFPLPYVGEISGTNYQGKVYANKTNVVIHTFTDWSTYNAYVTLCYTKTTDAANSYNYADENDYSTSEKIIGKWIDGKTLYQKTVQTTMPTVTTDGVEVNGSRIQIDANIDRFISAVGTVRYENNDVFLPESRLKDTSDPSKGCYTMRIACITKTHSTAAYRGTFMIKSNYAAVNGCTAYVTLKYTKS